MMSRTCKLIRDQLHYDALCCLHPEETEMGYRVLTLVTHRGMTIPMKYFEEHEHMSLYYSPEDNAYLLYKGHEKVYDDDCPPSTFRIGIHSNTNNHLLLMYSAFSFMMRMFRAARYAALAADAADAADAARAAAVAAATAATAAGAAGAADAARAAADAARAAAVAAFDAAGAAFDAAFDAARRAYKAMIKYRKEVLKNGKEDIYTRQASIAKESLEAERE